MEKWVYTFGQGEAEGESAPRDLLGGKGAGLAEMARLGLPVPPGFTITTEVCAYFYDNGKKLPPSLTAEVEAALGSVGRLTGRRLGDARDPLLVSARSGARESMPGMLDTVLNLGLNEITVEALAKRSGDPRFAYDSYRRFIQMYASVVLGIEHHVFEEILEYYKENKGVTLDTELSSEDLKKLIADFTATVEKTSGKPFPQDLREQLWGAIGAVFESWMNPRAVAYRRLHGIPASLGTAVTIQAMVFGNMGETSATGVAFTRNPSTGARELYGEFLFNAQGEDVVAGLRTPHNITEAARIAAGAKEPSMEAALPGVFAEFARAAALLETHYRDMQDVEFTIERGKLWMLQTRNGKRTSKAALRIAVDMAHEGSISKAEAIARVDPSALEQLLHPALDPSAPRQVIATGLPASPGAASGEIVFDPSDAAQMKSAGRKVILVRIETSPEDILGMHAAEGILTTRGGMTSHAAVVARGMGKPCVSGAGTIRVNYANATMTTAGLTFSRGDVLTIDGATGQVFKGAVKMRQPELSDEFTILMEWADAVRRMGVRANADAPRDARVAQKFGAEGIGLCRTEHMFFEAERIGAFREMILAGDEAGRRAALAKLLPIQRADFTGLFESMPGLPVTIRLLDPPLHEFVPRTEADFAAAAEPMGISPQKLAQRAAELHEYNPMLGFRGCRLLIVFPEIAEMQARAIFEG
ncbi:MAG: pyruvate, phosphate dikinase, partial [Beijerinckiaceae bacterium]